MPDSWQDLQKKASRVAGVTPWAQIDIMDGVFVSSHSWPYIGAGASEMRAFKADGRKLPLADKLRYEVDLMVATPEIVALDWIALGAGRIIIHVESIRHINTFLQSARARFPELEIGLAVNIETPAGIFDIYAEKVDVVQLMGIDRIGYQGQPFDERVIPKIRQLREKHPRLTISIDGAVNFETAPKLIEAGANRLVSGSAIFNSEDIGEAVKRLAS
jgi:ribulose-phosphate 3-epimerase